MGEINKFQSENLIIGVLSTVPGVEKELQAELENKFGPVDLVSSELNFDFTNYYDSEMGKDIKRWFYSFSTLIDPAELPRIKAVTNELEELWAEDGERKVNLDPGMLDLNRLILATTKNVGHRIPLQAGIYGEVTLIFMKKEFHPLPWTYPDYQSPAYIEILKKIRDLYKLKLKQDK